MRMQWKGNPLALLVGMQTGVVTLEKSTDVPQGTKNRNTLWSNNCTISSLPRRYISIVSRGYMYPNVYSSFINSQTTERAQMSINWWMDKEDVVYIYSGILFGNEKEWNLAIFAAMWMEPEGIMLSEISQSEKDKYHMFSLICGIWEM